MSCTKKISRGASLFLICGCLTAVSTTPSYSQYLEARDFTPWLAEKDITLDPQFLTERDIARLIPQRHIDHNQTQAPTEDTIVRDDLSEIERFYAKRIAEDVRQYGYDLFDMRETNDLFTSMTFNDHQGGAIAQDNVVLGPGDTLEIIFRGQKNSRETYRIQNQGQLIIGDLPPVNASGLTLWQLRERLALEAGRLPNTEIFVNLAEMRDIGVLVVGQVEQPGRHLLNSSKTVLDALIAAGGIKKTGSLRNIRLVRDGRNQMIDLYSLLLNGKSQADMGLREGDRLLIPPIGPTIAVAGDVKQPAIFEILANNNGKWNKPEDRSEKLSLNTLLGLSGGVMSPAEHRYIKLSLNSNGSESVEEVNDPLEPLFTDGSVLMVSRTEEKRQGTVELLGSVRQPGIHALQQTRKLSSLLPDTGVLDDNVYPLIGLIERWNEHSLSPEYIAFSPLQVVRGSFDMPLQEGDKTHLFSRKDIKYVQTTLENGADNILLASADRIPEYGSSEGLTDPPVKDSIRAVLIDHMAKIRGAVRGPGSYPITNDTSLENLIAVSGGLKREANISNVEVTSSNNVVFDSTDTDNYISTSRKSIDLASVNPAAVSLSPGDTVRVNQNHLNVEDRSVLVSGEVMRPGQYDLKPGDTYSSLIERAGGFTDFADPSGVIFSRKSERLQEKQQFEAQARDLELHLAALLQTEEKPNIDQVKSTKELVTKLRNAKPLGRITIEGDPVMLEATEHIPILLENGDRIHIPQRSSTVRVAGEVLSPAALFFRDGKSPSEYIREAGGFTYHADKDRAFVVYPDGSAQPLRVSYWNHADDFIPAGSTIIVPRDPKPFDFVESMKDVSQILVNLAITSAITLDYSDDD